MPDPKQAVLLVGFGGPQREEEIRPFLANVLRGRAVPPHRVEEVVRQYQEIGGRSPYNGLAADLARCLNERLNLPVVMGMRNGAPTLFDTLARLQAEGRTDIVAVVLSAYRSIPSWNYYLRSTAQALHAVGGGLRVRFVSPWHREPLFESAVSARVAQAIEQIPAHRRAQVRWFFTAHSIPVPWDQVSGYSQQIRFLCQKIAGRFQHTDWRLVYQSRSGRPDDPWLDPDISAVLSESADLRNRTVLVIPIGFLMDHVEVLFDLDIKARKAAESVGAHYVRALTVGTQKEFVDLLSQKVSDIFYEKKKIGVYVGGAGAPERKIKSVAVVGGGISGLAAAYRLKERADVSGQKIDIKVFDGSSRPGGVIETGHHNGILWEGGPDSFITEKPAALALARRLGMADDVISTNRAYQQSFVALGRRLHPTPEGFYLLAPSKLGPLFKTKILSWPGKMRAAMELFLPARKTTGDETLASFVRRRFGQEVLDRLAQPMVAGIYSADPETLSLQATFPRFLDMEAKGGVIRGLLAARRRAAQLPSKGTSGPRYGLFATFKKGVGSLVDVLVSRLDPTTFCGNSTVTRLDRIGGGSGDSHPGQGPWRLTINGTQLVEVDAVVLAIGSPHAGKLLSSSAPDLSALLAETPYGDVATVNVVMRRRSVRHPLNGFGFVVPATENRAVTGCTFSSVKFPGRAPEGAVLLRAFVGGAALRSEDGPLLDRVIFDLTEFLGLSEKPLWTELRRYPAAMPHYLLGHVDRVKRIYEQVQNISALALAGNGYFGIGLPDCVASGESAADRVAQFLKL